MRFEQECMFCGGRVDPDSRDTYRSVVGWELPRGGGGANAITLREPSGRFAHKACVVMEVTNRKVGISRGQASLL